MSPVVQRRRVQPRQPLHDVDALRRRHVRQCQLPVDVAYRVDALGRRAQVLVDGDQAPLRRDARLLQSQPFHVALNADRHDDPVCEHLFLALLIRREHCQDGLTAFATVAHQVRARPAAYALLVEDPFHLRAHLRVLQRQQSRQRLDNGGVDAIGVVDVGQLAADGPAADEDGGRGHGPGLQRLAARHHHLAVHRQARQRARPRPRRDDDGRRLQRLIRSLYGYRVCVSKTRLFR